MLFGPRLTSQDSDAVTQAALNQLHQIVVTTRDPTVVMQALGKYVAFAALRSARASTLPSAINNPYEAWQTTSRDPRQLSRLSMTISNIMKAAQEVANNSINNIKA